MKQNHILRNLGNALVALALAALLFIYYPLFFIYVFPPKISANITYKGYFIQIPKINAQAPIITEVDPFNEASYREKLKEGVAQAKGTAIPGEKGTSFLFAHSSGPPWEIARYNTVFFRLGELNKGDVVLIFKNGKRLQYKVTGKKEVWPQDVSVFKNLSKTQLIIQTCTPIGTDFKRLLIYASPI